jgi:hypothetical protein
MIDLSSGISLFISNDNQNLWTLSELIRFLSDEYTFLNVSFGLDKFGISSTMAKISVTENDYKEKIKSNLFRVEILVINLPYRLQNYTQFFNFLQSLNISIFIITPHSKSLDIIDSCNSHIRNFYEIKDNPDYTNSNSIASVELGSLSNRYLIKNINTDEKFTTEQYKKVYIRDKKIDIFLDDDLEH